MPGIINEQMPVEQPTPEQPAAAEKPQGKFRTNVVSVLPENLKEPFERVVLAGMKVMFSEQMQGEIQQALSGDKPMFQKLAESVSGLMGILHKQSKGMPPDVMIPAAIELLHEAAAYVNESGMGKVSPEETKQATQYIAVLLLHGQGAKKEDIMKVFAGGEEMSEQPEQPQQPQQGAVNGIQP